MSQAYFTQEYIDFFSELRENNDREWFALNKKRYEMHVKDPMNIFVDEMILFMQSKGEYLPTTSKECVFRIYRDIRFSKDKMPYKTRMSAVFAPKGRKEKPLIGLYFEMSDAGIDVYCCIYSPNKEELSAIRYAIAEHGEEFIQLITEKDFVDTFGEIKGGKNKRLPVEFREAAEEQPLIFNKSFYYTHHLDASHIVREDLKETFWSIYGASKNINKFFLNALQSQSD